MKIRTKLLLSATFLIGAIITIAFIVIITTQQVNTASQKETLANVLVQEVFTLNVLTVDYQLHQEERTRSQWDLQYQRIATLLQDQSVSTDPVAQGYITEINQNLIKSKNTFTQLLMDIHFNKNSGLEERLLGQLQVTLQSVVNAATQLSKHAQQERQATQQMANLLLFVFIVGGNITMLLATFFFYRSVVIPISKLDTVVQQVQKGDMTKRANLSSKDEIGQFALTFDTMLDALKESHENLEQKVQQRTEDLQTANKDLESFSYSVSHDLRAPLRAIDGFSQILEEDYANKFDDNGKKVVTTIRESTKKMGDLIDDLLTLSRIGRQGIKLQTIDMTTIAKTIFAEIHQQSKPTNAITFTCADLPPAQADPTLILHVWTNLLSNAVKYTGKKQQATITVGSKKQDGQIIYFVKDNGAGFDMKYVDKLFGVFQRLHDARDFEGTGVGLANVAKIITKHGGKVWAEGEVDKGATFYFTLSSKDS